MPDPNGEWSLKENNSELHYGIHSIHNTKVLYKMQNACIRKTGVTGVKVYGIGSKVNQFIYTLVCNYVTKYQDLRQSGSSVILFTRLFLYKMHVSEKGE